MPHCTPGLGAAEVAAGPDRILLLAALPQEVRPFLRRSRVRSRRGLPWPAWEFALGQGSGLLALSGMGAAAARQTFLGLLPDWQPQVLVSFGFAGALSPDLHPGDLVLAESFYHYDPETRVLAPVTPAPASPRPLPALLWALKEAGLPAFPASFLTTPRVVNKGSLGGALTRLPGAVLDLESAVLAELARREGLAFLALRAVTDVAGEEIPAFLFPEGRPPGQVGVLEALGWLAAEPRRLKDLLHLWRRSRLAAARLAAALLALLPLLPGSSA